jgi:hypothetical protein
VEIWREVLHGVLVLALEAKIGHRNHTWRAVLLLCSEALVLDGGVLDPVRRTHHGLLVFCPPDQRRAVLLLVRAVMEKAFERVVKAVRKLALGKVRRRHHVHSVLAHLRNALQQRRKVVFACAAFARNQYNRALHFTLQLENHPLPPCPVTIVV